MVLIQAVDLDDSLMGFFHDWVLTAADEFSEITVLALRVGRYNLPEKIRIVPLRSATSRSRWRVLWTLWKESWKRRKDYDAVFIRGDVQYALLGGWLWRLLGKRIILWYAHYKVNRLVLPASWCAHVICSSVPEALAHPWIHPIFIGQNISHEKFYPRERPLASEPLRLVSLSRVARIKGVKECMESFVKSGLQDSGTFTIVGPRLDSDYEQELSIFIQQHPSIVWGPNKVPYDQLPVFLRQFDIILNAYPASLDKAIVESMMSGVIPIVNTNGLKRGLPEDLQWLVVQDDDSRVRALKRVAQLSIESRLALGRRLREFAIEHHSLRSQIQRIERLCHFPVKT